MSHHSRSLDWICRCRRCYCTASLKVVSRSCRNIDYTWRCNCERRCSRRYIWSRDLAWSESWDWRWVTRICVSKQVNVCYWCWCCCKSKLELVKTNSTVCVCSNREAHKLTVSYTCWTDRTSREGWERLEEANAWYCRWTCCVDCWTRTNTCTLGVCTVSIGVNSDKVTPCTPVNPVPIWAKSTFTVRSLSASLGRTTADANVEVALVFVPVNTAVPTCVAPSQTETCIRSDAELDAVLVSLRPKRARLIPSFVARKRITAAVLPVEPAAAIAYEGLEGESETTSEPVPTVIIALEAVATPVGVTDAPEVTPVTVGAVATFHLNVLAALEERLPLSASVFTVFFATVRDWSKVIVVDVADVTTFEPVFKAVTPSQSWSPTTFEISPVPVYTTTIDEKRTSSPDWLASSWRFANKLHPVNLQQHSALLVKLTYWAQELLTWLSLCSLQSQQ